MKLPPSSSKVPSPTGDVHLWTARQVGTAFGWNRNTVRVLLALGYIPAGIYGEKLGSPLWSLRQVKMIATLVHLYVVADHRKDKHSEVALRRQVTRMKGAWDAQVKGRSNIVDGRRRWELGRLFGEGGNTLRTAGGQRAPG